MVVGPEGRAAGAGVHSALHRHQYRAPHRRANAHLHRPEARPGPRAAATAAHLWPQQQQRGTSAFATGLLLPSSRAPTPLAPTLLPVSPCTTRGVCPSLVIESSQTTGPAFSWAPGDVDAGNLPDTAQGLDGITGPVDLLVTQL